MEKNHETSIAQMRKSVEKLGISTQDYGDPIILRFLMARSMDPEKTGKMFVRWKKWRDEFVPLGYIPDSEVEDELSAKKVYLQGLSRVGEHPIMIMKGNKHFSSIDQTQFKKFVVHLLDKTIASGFKDGREIGNEKFIGVLDLAKLGYKNLDARGTITGFQLLQNYYPERLAKFYILSMPWFFVSVWKMISRFLEKATIEKIVIVRNEEEHRKFIKEIGEENLPEEYGGRAKLVALQEVSLNHFPLKE